MGSFGQMYGSTRPAKKALRYPGVPIPFRLQSKYEVKK